MKVQEFWSIYNARCKRLETPSFYLRDYPLSGDHGYFEVSIFQNEKGIWCIESTIERSNDV